MEHIRNLDEISYILTARVEFDEFMAVTAQAGSPPPGVKPPVAETFWGLMDVETIPNFIP